MEAFLLCVYRVKGIVPFFDERNPCMDNNLSP